MPEREHLRRLSKVWIKHPVYFLTCCTERRRPLLSWTGIPGLLIASWRTSSQTHGWAIGRYVVMPDHVHFFAKPVREAKPLSAFIRDWKRWTGGQIARALTLDPPIWQREFFDHVLRSIGSYDQKGTMSARIPCGPAWS